MPSRPRSIVIVGPTASGKSGLAIKLARKIGGEIISADSRQVYRGLDIGTGKVSKREQRLIKHHLLDVAPLNHRPTSSFTADEFKRLGRKAINSILKKNKIPIIVGGTGFYIDVLLGLASVASVPPNSKLRSRLDKMSAEELFAALRQLDPERSKNIDRKNKRRLIRAIEIITLTGKPVPKMNPRSGIKDYDVLWIGLNPLRKTLDDNIKKRLIHRIKHGMIAEVQKLISRGISHKRLEDLGLEYRYVSRYLRGRITRSELESQLFTEIRKYSKRQLTWFKRNKEIKWFSNSVDALAYLVRKY